MTRLRLMLLLAGALSVCGPISVHAGMGIRSVGGKVGFDVVQSEDTRSLYGGQIDLGTLFGSNLHVEPSFEFGTGVDNQGMKKRVASYNLGLKYVLEEEKSHIFGYFAAELGINAFNSAVFQGTITNPNTQAVSNVWLRQTDVRSSLNVIPIGLGRKLAHNRLQVFSEVKIVIGEGASDSSLRVSVGMEFLIR